MKILVISSNVFPVPLTGYGGLEAIAFWRATGLAAKGHQVSIVAPEGSQIPEGIEHIKTVCKEPENVSWQKYKDRLEKGDWDVIIDDSWEKWSYVSSAFRDPNLPIIGVLHSTPMVYQGLPKVQWPCFVGISEQHCTDIRLHLKCDAQRVYNGIDLAFYTPDANIKRSSERYLFLGRYTPEKGPLRAIDLARKLRVPLDCVGDTQLVGDAGYVERCRNACDGLMVRFMTELPRSETVKLYRNHKALISPIDWSEPFSLVHAEAAACGLPVLTLRKGAAPEVVKHGVSGFVLDTIEEMEQAIREDWPAKIKPEDCRTVAEQFSLQRMVEGYEQLCQEVVQGHRW